MSKQVYINLPVSDLTKSTAFYEALGFKKNPTFSDENGSAMMWSDDIIVMILTHDFYKKFIQERSVADTKTQSGVLLALTLDSKEAVQKFADTAKANGGDYFRVDMGLSEDMMFGYEVLDPDGNQWEPVWMNPEFNPENPQSS
ncbi:MAG TPA: VOC family protein [Candidatus Saccharimonadales bacterium]|nr:VOC family protein [Candidatus Saccharimonadales bacterium]